MIALLNEQKQAIIHRAVTRGLDPTVPLKPSGIPWLGDIPQHWEVRPLKQVSQKEENIPERGRESANSCVAHRELNATISIRKEPRSNKLV